MVTRKDVARRAGVSTAVVSYVINNGPRPTSPETRRRVLDAIDELGYQVNEVARSLRSKRSRVWGLMVPDTSNAFFSEVTRGVEERAFLDGFNAILCHTGGSKEKQAAYVQMLISRMVDGVIFITVHVRPSELRPLAERGIPVVIVDPENEVEFEPNYRGGIVQVDGERGGYIAGEYLFQHGRRKIACISGMEHTLPATVRAQGLLNAAADFHFDARVIWAGDNYEAGYEAAQTILRSDQHVDGIFACNDLLAIGAISALHENHIRVPEDVAVIGFDDIDLARYVVPQLTTISQPKHRMGQLAVDILLKATQSKTQPIWETAMLPVELVVRQSA